MPFGISIWELMILLIVLLLIFGAKRLPEMGRSLGKGMREFKDSVTGVEEAISTTTPTPTRVELPSAQSEPDTSTGESEARTERETVS
jgi:TatA/E family protein of Tat protein translocase